MSGRRVQAWFSCPPLFCTILALLCFYCLANKTMLLLWLELERYGISTDAKVLLQGVVIAVSCKAHDNLAHRFGHVRIEGLEKEEGGRDNALEAFIKTQSK